MNTSQEVAEKTKELITQGFEQNAKDAKDSQKSSSKISWMFRKMATLTKIFNSKKDDPAEPSHEEDEHSDESEVESHDHKDGS